MAKSPALYVDHMLQAIAHIEADIAGLDVQGFEGDRRARQLVERNLEILSEASRRLPDAMKATAPEIPWRAIAGIGNILRHDYHQALPAALWETCRRDLPPLKATLLAMRGLPGS